MGGVLAAIRIAKKLSMLLGVLAGIVLVLMMLQTVVDVLASNLFGRPIDGNVEIMTAYYMSAIVFFPLAVTEVFGEHINSDFAYRFFGRRMKLAAYWLGVVLTAGFFMILAYQTFWDAMKSFSISERMMGGLYLLIWPAKWFLPVSFTVAALATVAVAVEASLAGRIGEKEE